MFILSLQRDSGNTDLTLQFQRYFEYLASKKTLLPKSAYSIANTDWWYDATDHRSPHDAWLEYIKIEEPSKGNRNEIRSVSIEIKLLNAYHDRYIIVRYPEVYSYKLDYDAEKVNGHCDWRYDEIRVSGRGNVLHEIEWFSSSERSRWLIEASDIFVTQVPRP